LTLNHAHKGVVDYAHNRRLGRCDKQEDAGAEYLVNFLLTLHHADKGVVEPVLELGVAGKDLRHEEVHEGPQLHQIILQRRP